MTLLVSVPTIIAKRAQESRMNSSSWFTTFANAAARATGRPGTFVGCEDVEDDGKHCGNRGSAERESDRYEPGEPASAVQRLPTGATENT